MLALDAARRAPSRTLVGALLGALVLSALVFPLVAGLTHHHAPGAEVDEHRSGWSFRLPDHHHTRPHLEAAEPVWHPSCALCGRLHHQLGDLAARAAGGGRLDGTAAALSLTSLPAGLLTDLARRPRGPPRI